MPRRCWGAGAVHPINGRLRDELLNETLFTSLAQARMATALWRVDYNTARPHSQIAWQTPDEFARTFTPRRSLALRYANGSAHAPAASPAQQGKTTAGNELKTG
jgi:putative transposase